MKPASNTRAALAITAALIAPMAEARDDDRRPPGIPLPRQREDRPKPPPRHSRETMEFPAEFRSIDGTGNNPSDPTLGAAETPMPRLAENGYGDSSSSPGGEERPSAREVSNILCAADGTEEANRRGASDFLWQWGQFLDHDIVETPTIDPPEEFNIPVPAGDPWFDPQGTGTQEIPLNRSFHEVDEEGVRQQVNAITSFIDASHVYGSDEARAYALRRLDGSGMLKTTPSDFGDLLPYNDSGEENAPSSSPDWFLAGDVRANEQVGLTAMHTLFVREHNHWATKYLEANPDATGDDIYEFARMIVAAEMQHITYNEFLPLLLGPRAIPPYRGYSEEVDPSIANEFATAAYRMGHSLLSPILLRLDEEGNSIGDLPLAEAFFNPAITESTGIAPVLRGLASQTCQELDGILVDDVRNFLFGPPGSGGFDLAALNIQRGRDHGLPSYNEMREALGLRPARRFSDINRDRETRQRLEEAYGSVDDVDLWIGALCEPHERRAMVGETMHHILSRQFQALRDGDRFWYESSLDRKILRLVEDQTLADVIRRNTEIDEEIQDEVFVAPISADDLTKQRHPLPPFGRRR